MNVKKAGLVSAGVLAALVAASPLAWAVGPSREAPENCSFSANGGPSSPELPAPPAGLPINTVLQAPVEGNNAGHFGECSTFNQNNGEGNFEDNVTPLPLPQPSGLPG